MAAISLAAFLALCGYFVFAAIQGQFGHLKHAELRSEEQILLAEAEALKSTRVDLENKVKRLSDAYLDVELLDEQARKVLGLVRDGEIIIQ